MTDRDKLKRFVAKVQKAFPADSDERPALLKFPDTVPAGARSLARLLPPDEEERFLNAWKPPSVPLVSSQQADIPGPFVGPQDQQESAGATGPHVAASTESGATGPTGAAESTQQAEPVESAQHADSAGPETAVRSRRRRVPAQPQQIRARKVLKKRYSDGYPTREDVPDADLWTAFCAMYKEMTKTGELPKSDYYDRPSKNTVLREVGRK